MRRGGSGVMVERGMSRVSGWVRVEWVNVKGRWRGEDRSRI